MTPRPRRPLDLTSVPVRRTPDVDQQALTDLAEALATFRQILPMNSRDFAANPLDALLYGVLVGWGCEEHLDAESGGCDEDCGGDGAFEAVADRFGWSPEQVDRVRRYRAAVRAVAGD